MVGKKKKGDRQEGPGGGGGGGGGPEGVPGAFQAASLEARGHPEGIPRVS